MELAIKLVRRHNLSVRTYPALIFVVVLDL